MLDQLRLYNFLPSESSLPSDASGVFVLATCQRSLLFSLKELDFQDNLSHISLHGQAAYNYLLEVICGLQSQLVGENEIVGQFKNAYKNYVELIDRDNELLVILEKLLQDAKHIRTNYLLGLCQKTYASITRKQILANNNVEKVLILGSGQLAEDLINQFKKKCTVYIAARNNERVKELQKLHNIQVLNWEDQNKWINFSFIANSIGSEEIILNNLFISEWVKTHNERLLVDLGSPSVLNTNLSKAEGILRLDDILAEGPIQEQEKQNQIDNAKLAINEIVQKRARILKKKKNLKKSAADLKLNYAW